MRKIIFSVLLSIPLCLRAQGNLPLLQMPVLELLQYQVQKGKRAVAPCLFSKYGLRRIPTEFVVDGSRQLWGWHVSPNTDFDQSKQPFYRLFAKKDNSSLAIIDDRGGTLQIVFWNKGYYRAFVSGLQSHGYQLQQVRPANNVLRFQREGSSVIADVTVWADMYVLELHS
ncbi:hypothetical protein [Prevotella fusca]|uniref:Uncharacterized protein n=1 Tax=Prevotella fusca JCM 17724 TaxID=1236517 RepID=A0A0K1NN95_9BACT|nr:hypothetical protein [Prevotella fusca]AKU70161.1 hypothetical protein ADJ77_10175 [Prevotella fusca JCM 17724]QUB85777.1 hypothetical protein J5A51_00405 [Prevotella fusca JCM 17724]